MGSSPEKGFVKNEEVGLVDDGRDELDLLLHPFRQLVGTSLCHPVACASKRSSQRIDGRSSRPSG